METKSIEGIVEYAEEYAREKHGGQTRKDNITPYICHPAEIVVSLGACGVTDEAVLSAAWLHDVVEDCGVTLEEIYGEFNDEVGGLVDILSRRKPHESHDHYNTRVLAGSPEAKLIKVADTEHNCRTLECLDKEAQERKLREAREVYLPLRDELCALYDCGWLFDALEKNVNSFTIGGESGDESSSSSSSSSTYVIVRQEWRESERGWGQRPDGYSLHLTPEDQEEFVKAYWDRMPDKTPHCYSFPSGKPEAFEVDDDIYQRIKESENGIRSWK